MSVHRNVTGAGESWKTNSSDDISQRSRARIVANRRAIEEDRREKL